MWLPDGGASRRRTDEPTTEVRVPRRTVDVVPVAQDDLRDVTGLWLAARVDSGSSKEAAHRCVTDGRLTTALCRPGVQSFVARLDGEAVGYAITTENPVGLSPQAELAIEQLWVGPDTRRHGVAKALIAAVLSTAERAGSSSSCRTCDDRPRRQPLLRAVGLLLGHRAAHRVHRPAPSQARARGRRDRPRAVPPSPLAAQPRLRDAVPPGLTPSAGPDQPGGVAQGVTGTAWGTASWRTARQAPGAASGSGR